MSAIRTCHHSIVYDAVVQFEFVNLRVSFNSCEGVIGLNVTILVCVFGDESVSEFGKSVAPLKIINGISAHRQGLRC